MTPAQLANLRPVKPGEPGRNPLGINRKRPLTERMAAHSELLLTASEFGESLRIKLGLPETATWADASVHSLMRKAADGDLGAIKEIADRIEGKTTAFEEEKVDAKEAHVYLIVPGEDDKRVENAKMVVGNVEITGGPRGPDNKSK